MPSTVVQSRAPRDNLPLKPIQPTQLWTFDNAFSLLKSCHDPYILEALDEFLLLNSKLLSNPLPFQSSANELIKKNIKEISLRNILYSDITENNIKDAEKISKLLDLDNKEVIRIVSQTCKRSPERKVYDFKKLKSKLPDDREIYLEEERILLYVGKILRERRTILKLVIELLNNKTNIDASSTIQNIGKEIYLSKTYITDLIKDLDKMFQSLITGSYKTAFSENLDSLIFNETVLLITELMRVLVELLVQNPNITKEMTKYWFSSMSSSNFLLNLGPYIKYPESFTLLQSLATVVSILFLDLEDNYGSQDSANFINDPQAFKFVNDSITDPSNTNSIVMYSWSIILLRKYYMLEEFKSDPLSLDFTKILSLDQIDSTINDLNIRCVKLGVFQDLSKLNDLLKFDNIYSAILSSVILSAMPLVSLTPEISSSIEKILKNSPNSVIEKFFDNESTRDAIVLSRAKFPILLSPYIKLASINGNFAFNEFNELKSFMSIFEKHEFNKLYEIDDENTELIKLTKWIDLYPPYELNKKLSLVLNIGTKGKILPASNDDEVLVTFLYKYNGWAFLGRVLQNVSKLFNNSDIDKVEFVVNILNLLTKVVEDNSIDDSKTVLESMSAYTDDSDTLEVILRLFEQGLHSRNIEILEAVLNLLTKLMPFLSYRIWPYLSKSALLSSNGKEGFASTIFGAIEMVNGDYKFTISLIKLTDSLVQNCLSLDDGYPEKSKSIILSRFVSHLILYFESFVHCRYNQSFQKMEIGVLILDIFSNILAAVYGIDEESKSSEKVTKVFAESSIKILDSFLTTGSDYSRTVFPILSTIDSLATNFSLYELTDITGFWHINWIRCSLAFSQLIISIRSSLNYSPSAFEKSLFIKLPELVSTYSQHEALRKDILDLITGLTNSKWFDEPTPSLLSHLSRDYAQVLLHSLASDLDNSFDDYKLKVSLYDFICAVMDGNQEGLSVLFISGRDVFGDFTKNKDETKEEPKPISLLSILKRNVRDIKYYPNSVSVHLADAIALAFNSWTTARENEDDIEFIDELISRIQSTIKGPPQTAEEYVTACYELKLVSKLAEILSLIVFTTKDETCKDNIAKLITADNFINIMKKQFSMNDYKSALHSNLQISFETTFPNFKLSQFSGSLVKRNRFGIATVYSLVLMDIIFKNKEAWPQLREQIIASSINLQYLNAQISVAKSFGALLTAYFRRSTSPSNSKFLGFACHLLRINVNEGIPAEFFAQTYQERIELAFFIIYSIYNNQEFKKDSKQVFEIIKVCLELLSSPNMNFLQSLTNGTSYYRPLLRILYCSLNLIKDESSILIEYFNVFSDLFDLIITRSTKTLLIELQNNVYLSKTNKSHASIKMNEKIDDLMLILSVLKIFVKMKSSPNLHHEMASLVNENGIIKSLLSLYSFSHLIEVNDEHIFAQLSLMFIQELMTIEVIAEVFVASGLFVVLVESSISSPIRNGGISIISAPQYHSIWTNGLLPIFLTSISKLGPNVLPEVCMALQLFGKQTESCIESWSKDSSSIRITSSTISETSQILLLFQLLQSLNVKDYLKGTYEGADGDKVNMSVLPGLDTEAKRDDFINCINNLLKHPKFLTSRVAPSSLEELRIIEKGGPVYDKFVKNLIDEIRDLKDF